MTPDADFWKALTMIVVGALATETAALWALTKRPTFEQVKGMISQHEDSGCFSRMRGEIMLRLANHTKELEKMDRHLLRIEGHVEEIKLDIEQRRHLRARRGGSLADEGQDPPGEA